MKLLTIASVVLISLTPALSFAMTPLHSFEIYLIKTDIADLQRATLADTPVLTAADIEIYDWTTHELTLSNAGVARLPSVRDVGVHGLPFIVVVDGIRCYRGAFWISISSVSSSNPIINVAPIHPTGNKITIERAYPSDRFGQGEDPRGSRLIHDSLLAIGKLREKK